MEKDVSLKLCKKCGQYKPATTEFFSTSSRYSDGFITPCKACRNAYAKTRYQERSEEIRAGRREYYWRDPERHRADSRQYMADHQEEINQKRRAAHAANPEPKRRSDKRYYAENKEKVRAKQRKWEREKPEKKKAIGARYLARKRNLPNEFTGDDWQRALEYWNYRCAVCGRPIGLWHTMAADHWIPLNSPGCPGRIPMNIIPLCCGDGGCNNSKHDKLPDAWLIERLGKGRAVRKAKEIEAYFKWVQAAKVA